jgi:hypothetical protein
VRGEDRDDRAENDEYDVEEAELPPAVVDDEHADESDRGGDDAPDTRRESRRFRKDRGAPGDRIAPRRDATLPEKFDVLVVEPA